MLYADPVSIWLWYKNPRLYLAIVVFGALSFIGYYTWRHYFPPVVKNEALTEAVERYVNLNLNKEDFFLEGEVENIEVSQVLIHKQDKNFETPNTGWIMVGIYGTYNVNSGGDKPKLKSFKVKHRMQYEKIGEGYKIKYKRLPNIRYY